MAYGGQHYLDSRHGSPAAAEICVRAGAAEVTVADTGVVHPGILVRQPYEDADIGQYKAVVLARRLNNVHADDRVSALPQDIITTILTDQLVASQFDLIVDATANAAVVSRLERCRAKAQDGEHRLPEDPEDGFLHSAPEAPEVTLAVAHGLHGGGQVPVQVLLCSWVPQLAAEPKPPVIEVCVDRHPGPEMTPGQARQLAAVLIELSDLAEVGQLGSTRSPGMVAGS